MKKIILILLSVLSIVSLSAASDTLFFKVSLLGVKCAEVELIENYLENDRVEIIYHTYTVGPFAKWSPTDYWYYYYCDSDYMYLDSLYKDVWDKDLDQQYSEVFQNGTIYYNQEYSRRYEYPLHHILTALVFFQHHPEYMKTDIDLPFHVSDEGKIHDMQIGVMKNERKAQDEVYFSFNYLEGESALKGIGTDVFNWAIYSTEGSRMLAYSHEDHRITEGAFSVGWGGLYLRAKRINK